MLHPPDNPDSPSSSKDDSASNLAPFRLINIDAAAYTTYRAILCWMQTGSIWFAPLRSKFRLEFDSINSRNNEIDSLRLDPSYPLAASPKSVYRLAHFLDIPSLASLALANLKSQLTIQTIPFEVFGDVAACYQDIAEIELRFAAANWGEIQAGEGIKVIEELVEKGLYETYGLMSMRLLRELGKISKGGLRLSGRVGRPIRRVVEPVKINHKIQNERSEKRVEK